MHLGCVTEFGRCAVCHRAVSPTGPWSPGREPARPAGRAHDADLETWIGLTLAGAAFVVTCAVIGQHAWGVVGLVAATAVGLGLTGLAGAFAWVLFGDAPEASSDTRLEPAPGLRVVPRPEPRPRLVVQVPPRRPSATWPTTSEDTPPPTYAGLGSPLGSRSARGHGWDVRVAAELDAFDDLEDEEDEEDEEDDATPIEEALAVRGIGPGTIERLLEAGIYTLGDVLDAGVDGIPGVGPAKADALERWALRRRRHGHRA